MTGDEPTSGGWFEGVDPGDEAAAVDAVLNGRAEGPAEWPALAVEAGFADDEEDYYEKLHEATMAATRQAVRAHEQSDDQQLKHSVRAMDDHTRQLV